MILFVHEKIDARTLSQDIWEAQRLQIMRLRESGRSNKETAEIVGVSPPHSSTIWQRYKKQDLHAISKGQRGRRNGDQRTLTSEQEEAIKRLLIDKSPHQLKLSFALWTLEAVQFLIQQRWCGFSMPLSGLLANTCNAGVLLLRSRPNGQKNKHTSCCKVADQRLSGNSQTSKAGKG